jgi:hypothetical protein
MKIHTRTYNFLTKIIKIKTEKNLKVFFFFQKALNEQNHVKKDYIFPSLSILVLLFLIFYKYLFFCKIKNQLILIFLTQNNKIKEKKVK